MKFILPMMLVLATIIATTAFAGDLEEEHKKAKENGYEKNLEDAIEKYGGSRLKEEDQKLHEQEKDGSHLDDRIETDQGAKEYYNKDPYTIHRDDHTLSGQ